MSELLKTTVDGKTVDMRTAKMLKLWEFNCLRDLFVIQGCFSDSVSQSAGTHDGSGAIDLSVYGMSDKDIRFVVKQGRLAGFAAYFRENIPKVWERHIHAISIGTKGLSPAAQRQVVAYFNAENALADHGPDTDPRIAVIRVYPSVKLKNVSLWAAISQFKTSNPKPSQTVRRIQWCLNEKLGLRMPIDGIAGPKTRDAYARWEKVCKAPVVDGIPGMYSLRLLGQDRFKVGRVAFERHRKFAAASKESQQAAEQANPTFGR